MKCQFFLLLAIVALSWTAEIRDLTEINDLPEPLKEETSSLVTEEASPVLAEETSVDNKLESTDLDDSDPEDPLGDEVREITIVGGVVRTCQLREVFLQCPAAHTCERTCATLNQACVITPTCTPKCFCRPGNARDANNRCVPYLKCPGISCPRDEEFIVCADGTFECERTCAARNTPCPANAVCNGGCQCRKGYFRNAAGVCVKANRC